MDPVSAIVAALVGGATAAASGVASDAVKDAYQGLKKILVDTYKLASTALLEKKPSHPAYQDAVQSEVKDNPAIAADPAVIEKAQAVVDALAAEPPAQLAAWGVDIGKLTTKGSLKVDNVSGTAGGFRAGQLDVGTDATFSNIRGGSSGN